MIAATLALPSRLDRALALADSFVGHNPATPFVIVVLGHRPPLLKLPEGTEATTLSELGVTYDELLNVALDGDALQNALIARLAEKLFDRDERVLVLDDSLLVCGSLENFDRALDDAAAAVVADPLALGTAGGDFSATIARGTVCASAIAFRECAQARRVMTAWPTLGLAPIERRASARDGFQAWCDALPLLPGVAVLEPGTLQNDAGLSDAHSAAIDAGSLSIDGVRAALVDLAEFDPAHPHLASAATRGARLSRLPKVADLLEQYAATCSALRVNCEADPWTSLADGTPLTPLLRELASVAISKGKTGADVFSSVGTDEFYEWLSAPATMGEPAGLNRYHEAIWNERSELRDAYPHLDGPDGFEFAGWLHRLRPAAIPLPERLEPPLPKEYELRVEPVNTKPPWGVNVTGLLTGKLGLGESARRIVDTFDEIGVPNKPVQGRLRVPGGTVDEFEIFDVADAPFAINLVCLNGDTIQKLANDVGNDFFKRRYTAALWWWELPELPEGWSESFNLVDEVWVASHFMHEIIAPVSPVPVHRIKQPVLVSPFERRSRADLGMPDDFVFLFVHDYHSTTARKNPVGLINAFREAFPEGSGASLVIKSINGDRMPLAHEASLVAARGRADIHFVDGFVESQIKNAMIDCCDCYVSLHRSEGFGQTIAEAMWLGKPAIATRYGGNLDFMTSSNSYLVDFERCQVGADAHPYPADGIWADPNIDHAAELMREVFENPSQAAARGALAAADIRRENGVAVAGQSMVRRLESIYGWIEDDPQFALNPARHVARVPRATRASGADQLAPKQIAKHLAQRLEHLTLRRQRSIDDAVGSVERQLAASNAELVAQLQRLSAEIAGLRADLDLLDEEADTESEASRYQR